MPARSHPCAVLVLVALLGAARADAQSASTPLDATPVPDATLAPPPAGRILAVEGQVLTVDLGREAGLAVGDAIAFAVHETIELGDDEPGHAERLVAVGEVTAVSRLRARVRLGMNERVPSNAIARRTEAAPSRSLVAPPPSDARTELIVGARLVGSVGAVGGGMIVDARLDHRFGARLALRLRLDPTGLVGFRRPDPDEDGPLEQPAGTFAAPLSSVAVLSYDTGLVALGAGVGVTVTTRLDERHIPCTGCAEELRHHGFETGLTFATAARFGHRDGIHLEVDTAFVTVLSRIEMSRLAIALHVPVSPSIALVARANGGFAVTGLREGELAARMLVRGNGNRGSLFLVPRIGYLALAERATLETTTRRQPRPTDPALVHGVAAGVSIERRY